MAERRNWLLLGCLATLMTSSLAAVFTPQEEVELDRLVSNNLACRRVPGMAVAVVKTGQEWSRGYGLADLDLRRPVTPDTLFGIGALTKAFTSSILGMLIDDSDGKYTWSSKLDEILGSEFSMPDALRQRSTSLRDALSHRTGLKTAILPLLAGYPATLDQSDFAKRFRLHEDKSEFREEFEYNNWPYFLAARACKAMSSGRKWEELLKSRILEPLGMTSTRVIGQSVMTSDPTMARPYVYVGSNITLSQPNVYRLNPFEAAGGVASSARDMAKWLQFVVTKGEAPRGDRLVDYWTMQEALDPKMALAWYYYYGNNYRPAYPADDVTLGYGYGWFRGSYRGHDLSWHSSGFHGYTSYVWVLPDVKAAVFVSVNGNGDATSATAVTSVLYHVTDVLLGQRPWVDSANVCTYTSGLAKTAYLQSLAGRKGLQQEFFDHPVVGIRPSLRVLRAILNGGGEGSSGGGEASEAGGEGGEGGGEASSISSSSSDVSAYVGTYGHLLFGDVTVTATPAGELRLTWGKLQGKVKVNGGSECELELTGDHAFVTHGKDYTWFIPLTFTGDLGSRYRQVKVREGDEVLTFDRNVRFSNGFLRSPVVGPFRNPF